MDLFRENRATTTIAGAEESDAECRLRARARARVSSSSSSLTSLSDVWNSERGAIKFHAQRSNSGRSFNIEVYRSVASLDRYTPSYFRTVRINFAPW